MIPPDGLLDQTDEGCLDFATYAFVRSFIEIKYVVDGWSTVFITVESRQLLEVVGMMHILPAGVVPVLVRLERTKHTEIAYEVQAGINDETWQSLSDSRQWKVVYLHATQGISPAWSWGETVTGVCRKLLEGEDEEHDW